jgi:hypothetical protein
MLLLDKKNEDSEACYEFSDLELLDNLGKNHFSENVKAENRVSVLKTECDWRNL